VGFKCDDDACCTVHTSEIFAQFDDNSETVQFAWAGLTPDFIFSPDSDWWQILFLLRIKMNG